MEMARKRSSRNRRARARARARRRHCRFVEMRFAVRDSFLFDRRGVGDASRCRIRDSQETSVFLRASSVERYLDEIRDEILVRHAHGDVSRDKRYRASRGKRETNNCVIYIDDFGISSLDERV